MDHFGIPLRIDMRFLLRVEIICYIHIIINFFSAGGFLAVFWRPLAMAAAGDLVLPPLLSEPVTLSRYTRALHSPLASSQYTRALHSPIALVTLVRYTRPLHSCVTLVRYTRALHSHSAVALARYTRPLH